MASGGGGDDELKIFLNDISFSKYYNSILKQNVYVVEDLQDIEKTDLEEMGMKQPEIRRFLRKVASYLNLEESRPENVKPPIKGPDLPFDPRPVSRKDIDRIYSDQSNRTHLRIFYQLFTELNPDLKQLERIDCEKLCYYDLVNIICQQESNKLGKDKVVELYTCEGYPLAPNPMCYLSKLSDWSLESYDKLLLYAVPRLKIYHETDEDFLKGIKMPTKGSDFITIRNKEAGFGPITIDVDCKKVKVKQLIKYIHEMTYLPPSKFKLQLNSETLENENQIKSVSALEVVPDKSFWLSSWNENFCFKTCLPTWKSNQTQLGVSKFFACLYAISENISKKSEEQRNQILGHIRSITSCAPLIHALKFLFDKGCLSLAHRTVIQEVLMIVFRLIKPKQLKGNNSKYSITIEDNKILEESNIFWTYFREYSRDFHYKSEVYTTFNLCCSKNNNRMIEPRRVLDCTGEIHIIDKQNFLNKISNEMLELLPNYERMLKCFTGFDAVVWEVKDMTTPNIIDLTWDWKDLESKYKNIPVLCIQMPLALKDITCPAYCMIPTVHETICNYVGPSKNRAESMEGYDPLDGSTFTFDPDDLDLKLREKKKNRALPKNDDNGTSRVIDLDTITRSIEDIEEIIMVALDCSGSMDNTYFEEKNKYELAMTGFEVFCNRTTAYNLKNMVGLVIFGTNPKLEMRLTESFRYFSGKIISFPDKGSTAIYDAIEYSAKELITFKQKHGILRNIDTRILCLTDGSDNASEQSPTSVVNLLITNNIVMDSVLLAKKCSSMYSRLTLSFLKSSSGYPSNPFLNAESSDKWPPLTHNIAKASGGCSFQPNNQKDLLQLFEFEIMLSLSCRKNKEPILGNIDNLTSVPFDNNPEFKHPEYLNKSLQTSEICLANAVIHNLVSTQSDPEKTRRILKELAFIQINNHPNLEVFPCSETVDFWQIILEAPTETPYEGGIFRLYIQFNNEYPRKPPNIRFVTPIYHCNINSTGRVCHKILDRFYAPTNNIRELLDYVYGLLLDPVPEDPLDSFKASLLTSDKQRYEMEAKQFTELHAKMKNKREVRIELLGTDEIYKKYPKEYICPLTLKMFENPVITPYGETYEKVAIEEYITNNKQKDPYSFKPLTINQLIPNKNVKDGVERFQEKLKEM